MFCNKCGAEIEQSAKFCHKCGNSLEGYGPAPAKITFRREGQYYGCAVNVKVFLDNNQVASMGAGNEFTVETTTGKHRVDFNVMGGNGGQEIEITPEHTHIKVVFKLGVGMITAKPKIVSILNMN